jgi:glycosyltransferase involved in cell wall biosynthesis
MKLSSVSILIPCYNVQETIEGVITEALDMGNKNAQKIEIIALDDASTDSTLSILRGLQRKIPTLSILVHTHNKGYGAAIKTLYHKGKYAWLFSLPGDGQFSAKELLKLIPLSYHADMILGWRKNRHDTTIRRVQSKIYNGLLHMLFGVSVHDVNTIRLVKRSLIQSISLVSSSAFVDAELTIKAKQQGYRIQERAITHKKRQSKGATGGKVFKTIIPTIVDMVRFGLPALRFPRS